MNLVISYDYTMHVTISDDRVQFPDHSLFRLFAVTVFVGFVVYQIATAFRGAIFAVVSTVDTLFATIFRTVQYLNRAFAQETIGTSLSNVQKVTTIIKRILVIVAILLFLLDKLRVIDVTVVPKWFLFV